VTSPVQPSGDAEAERGVIVSGIEYSNGHPIPCL